MGLTIRRTMAAKSISQHGLSSALPEKVSAEITHPSRKRAEGGNDLPLAMVALFGQYLRGPIPETLSGENIVTTEVNYWLNQSSSIELTADDEFQVEIVPVAGATYEIYAPETPVMGGAGQQLYNYELQRMASDLREKTLYTAGFSALIIPNDPDSIERVTLTVDLGNGGQRELPLLIRELLSQAQRANPFVSVLDGAGVTGTNFLLTMNAEYILLSLNAVASVELHNSLGAEYDYMLIRVNDRNSLG